MKRLGSVLLALMLSVLLSVTAFAVTPRWSYIYSASADVLKENNTYQVEVSASTDVKKIEATLVLYEKGLFGIYSQKDSATKTLNSFSGILYDSYTFNANKDYKVEATVTVTTTSNATETVTVYYAE